MQKVIFLSVILLLAGCDMQLSADDLCAMDSSESFAGEWSIDGGATMNKCENPSMDGDFSFYSEPLVLVEGTDVDGNSTLVLAEPIEGFELTNVTRRGTSLEFWTREKNVDGDILLHFDGAVEACGVVEGDLKGEGPGGCEIRGTFTLSFYSSYESSQPWISENSEEGGMTPPSAEEDMSELSEDQQDPSVGDGETDDSASEEEPDDAASDGEPDDSASDGDDSASDGDDSAEEEGEDTADTETSSDTESSAEEGGEETPTDS